jgi:hypothetical protein
VIRPRAGYSTAAVVGLVLVLATFCSSEATTGRAVPPLGQSRPFDIEGLPIPASAELAPDGEIEGGPYDVDARILSFREESRSNRWRIGTRVSVSRASVGRGGAGAARKRNG